MTYKDVIRGQKLDGERALYNTKHALIADCSFEGPADGESALKECSDFGVENCFFALRYPLWHASDFRVSGSEMTENARAAVWYSKNGEFSDCRLNGIKVFRECDNIVIRDCLIDSPESCWRCRRMDMSDTKVVSEYLFFGSSDLHIKNCALDGKYPLQYVENALIENCEINFKDALWHSKNATLKNCVLHGEYLGWYSENLVLENCVIDGTQPLCYCKNLTLVNCRMPNCDLAFELSDVHADVNGEILSVRSPLSGEVICDGAGEIVNDVTCQNCTGKIRIRNKS